MLASNKACVGDTHLVGKNPKADAALRFAAKVTELRGKVSADAVEADEHAY